MKCVNGFHTWKPLWLQINSLQLYILAISLTSQTGLCTCSVQTSKQKLEIATVFAVDVVLNHKDAETNCKAAERPPDLHCSLTMAMWPVVGPLMA